MKRKVYRRRPGDFEIRLLRDGRLVFIGPDQALVDLARGLDGSSAGTKERKGNGPRPGSTDTSSE
jgi:hypothetical protein